MKMKVRIFTCHEDDGDNNVRNALQCNDNHRQHQHYHHGNHSHQGILTLTFNRDCREGGTSSHVHITAKPGDEDSDDNDDHHVDEDDDNDDKAKPDQSVGLATCRELTPLS